MCRRLVFLLFVLAFGLMTSAQALTIIWVSDNKTPTGDPPVPADQGWVDLLTSTGYPVDYTNLVSNTGYWNNIDADAAKLAALNAADLIIVSRDLNSGSYANNATELLRWNTDITKPVLCLMAHMARSAGALDRWRWLSTTDTQHDATPTLQAVATAHPIFSGVSLNTSNQVNILTSNSSISNPTSAGNGTLIATQATTNQVWIAEWPTGVEFYSGSGYTTGGPRMLFCAGGIGPDGRYNLNAQGEKMFLNAVNYMLGGKKQTEAWKPTPKDNGVNVPRTATLTWTSGHYAAQHKVWFGTDCGSMTLQATLPRGTETYTKTGLDYLTTYYWAVDEVNEPNTWQLPYCWSFITQVDVNTVIDVNLVGYWKFDGDASDSSGYKNHGTLMGTAALVPGGPVTFGEVLELYDQADSLVDCGNSPFLAIPSMARNITVSAWVKSRAGTFNEDWAPFVTKRGEDSLGWQLRKRGGQDRACFTLRGTTPGGDTNGTTPIMDNEWHCLVGTYDGTQRRLYVDGTPEVMQGETGNIADAPLDNVAIGAKYRNGNATNPQGWMWGQIDEVRIYNRALSQAEVGELLERYVAYDPVPANGAQNAAITTNLSWTAGTDVVTHRVYFGTDKTSLPKVAEPPAGTTTWDPPGDLAYFTKYYWTVTEVNAIGTEYITDTWSFRTMADPAIGTGQILREIWQNITPTGTAISLLYNWPDFPYNPTSSDMLTEFATDPSWDQYGGRIHGWLYVPVSGAGDYTFYITSDDNGQLWLSTDEDPANAQLIAQETGSRTLYDWPATGEEVSAPITLAGGKSYYISALWKEGTGGDHCAVGWQGPLTGNEIEVIAGCFLTPFVPLWPNRPSPADKSVDQPRIVTLRWTAGIDKALGAPNTTQRVYIGTDAASVAAAGPGSPQDKGLTAGPNEFGPITKNFYERVYWKVVETDSASNLYSSPVWSYKVIYDATLVPDPNLVLWYKFDGDASDSSGHGRDGTEVGAPTYVAGQIDQAINLVGSGTTGDRVDTGLTASYLEIGGNNPRTVTTWVYTRAFNNGAIFDVGTRTNGQDFCLRTLTTTNQWRVQYYGGAFDIDFTYPSLNEWVHLGHVHDGASTRIYANGQLIAEQPRTLATADTNPFHVGCYGWYPNYFDGVIDDFRLYNHALDAAGILQVYRVNLAWAYNPSPRNGATGVSIEAVLNWTPGDYAPQFNSHYVYFGADDPANMVRVSGPQTPNNYTPGILDLGTTYYWAVDEANTLAPGGVDAGSIWSFTTIDHLVVDDMESYGDGFTPGEPGNCIFFVWRDGWTLNEADGFPAGFLSNNTGASIGHWDTPYAETTIVSGGGQSMPYFYDNDGEVHGGNIPGNPANPDNPLEHYSKAKAEISDLQPLTQIGPDWTLGGAKALSLQFYGTTTNAIEPMWVQLTDASNNTAKVLYGDYADEDVNDMNEASWHEWLIDLADFTGVNVSNVKSIAIGVGNEGGPAGGSGTLYFDDIRLYTSRCVLTRRSADFAAFDYAPAGNPDGDCVIDYRELELMTQDWLLNDYNVTGDATLINFPNDDSQWVAGKKNNALDFDGSNDNVYSAPTYLPTSAFTLSLWINPGIDLGPTTPRMDLIYWGVGNRPHLSFNKTEGTDGAIALWPNTGAADFDGPQTVTTSWTTNTWHHIAATFDGTDFKIYANGVLEGTVNHPGTHRAASGPHIGSNGAGSGNFFDGQIDDFRIYAYALSGSDVAKLANQTGEPAAGPLFWFKFDETSGDIAHESMGTLIYVPLPRPAIDLYGDGIVNFKDYAVLVTRWLEEELYP